MKKMVLLYNFSKNRFQLIKNTLLPLGCQVKAVVKKDYAETIGYLIGETGFESTGKTPLDETFSDEMMILCGIGGEMIDVILAALRINGVGRIDLKAIVTPINIHWDSVTLYKAVKADHEEMHKK